MIRITLFSIKANVKKKANTKNINVYCNSLIIFLSTSKVA